jgi:hypothetical protein
MVGYPGTPLAQKLGIKPGSVVAVLNAQGSYEAIVSPQPEGVRLQKAVSVKTDLVHLFCERRSELVRRLPAIAARLRPDAAVWVSWPKKASKVPTDITEDTVREVALPLGLVDIKLCAVTGVWSGLKLVVRRENRSGRT